MKNIIIDNISTSYFISEKGECYNQNTSKYLKGQINPSNGYLYFYLTLPNRTKKRVLAHRLVAQTYLDIPANKSKTQVNHIDGDKTKNWVENLEWVTPSENQQHALDLELRKFEHVFCFNSGKVLVAEYKSISEASLAVGLSKSIISQEINKEVKSLSGGFYWAKESSLKETKSYENLGRAKKVNQYTKDGKFINSYSSTGEAARSLGIKNSSHIGECCRGKIKTYKNFVWRYSEDIVSPSSEN